MTEKLKEVFKIKSRWYEFWRPKEKIIVINHCKHKWDIVETQFKNRLGDCVGDGFIYTCKLCGEIRQIYPKVNIMGGYY